MKITRDDIKEMVNETLSIIIEGRRPYDNLTDFFNNNIEKIKLGQLEYNDLPSYYFSSEANFINQLNSFSKANNILSRNKIQKANQKQQMIADKTPTKSKWTNFFLQNEKGIDATLDDAINYFNNDDSVTITPGNFRRQKFAFKANYISIVKEKIDDVRQWFYSNGGENLNSENYQIGLCEIVKKYKNIFKASLRNDILQKVDNSDELFYKFIKVILFTRNSNEHITELYKTNDMYLCFVAYKLLRSKEIIPTDIDTVENRLRFSNEYNFKQNIEHFEVGDNKNKTTPFCKTILSFLNIEKSSRATSDNILLLVNRLKENGGYSYLIKELNWLKEKSDEIKAPSEITYLYEVLHLLFYIAGYKSNNISLMFEKIDINYYNLMPQIMRMAFGLRFYLQYGENYLKLDRLIDENNADLFNPYTNALLSNEYICSILRNCIDLNIPQLNVKIGLPIEQIIEYWGNCYSFMTLTNTERYGSDIVLNWENLLNPNFSAEEAMERAGIDKFAKGKFKKSNKRGEIVNLSFYDFMMWDVKIKEKTQKEIYFFLANNTTVPWKYEYNRYDKQADEELGKKSIDIFNENYGICIEYQGEQHFRPFGVKGDDDDSIEMVLLGFKEKGVGPISTLKNELIERIVLGETPDKLETLIKDRLIQMCKKYINVPIFKEAYDAFQQGKDTYNIKTIKGDNDNHYIRRVISVKRFLDEINVIKQKKRDEIKVEAVRNKNWDMLYVLPGKKNAVTNDDMEMIIKLVGDNHFFWKQDEEKLLNYLSYRYNIVKQINNNTLFEQIVKELLK